ncbi:MAG TPA: IspD/TarI family cytidylyltransferase [Acidimicrobiia bacterium]|nr:IspD/TarI family cytidylyltransferase [Acidimicrobiia bacterium]
MPDTRSRYRHRMAVAGIVLAGGSGSRIQREVNKVLLTLGDREMLAYSLDTMDRCPAVDLIVLVVRAEDRASIERMVDETPVSKLFAVVPGGATRHQSERHGLESLAGPIDRGEIDVVVVHDGARPFMTSDLLEQTIAAARRTGGGVPGLPLDGPVYERQGTSAKWLSPDRLRRMQTPQAFLAAPLLEAFRTSDAMGDEGVDTAETVERHSELKIEVVPGDPRNIKVTFVEDIFRAEEYAASFGHGGWRPGI